MKKKSYLWLAAGCVILLTVIGGLLYAKKKMEREALAITAMYVPFGEGLHIFVDEQRGAFEVAAWNEEFKVYDIKGKEIAFDQLVKGNIVKIYGDGVMMESYPGQYPGVTEIRVIKEGNPADADVYQDIVDGIYTKPDPAEPPYMQVLYTTDMISTAAMTARGSYTWSYVDEDGMSKTAAADCAHVLQWGGELNDLRLTEAVDLTLHFGKIPDEVEVVRYDMALLGTLKPPPGEKVELVRKDGEFVIEGGQGSYVYAVTGIWENGRVEFGFMNTAE